MMCLLAVLSRVHPEAPLVVAANRDELWGRPAEPMQVLRPAAPRVLGGRDTLAGGTWLAVNEYGVCAGLTNRPSRGGRDPSRRSRGKLPLMLAEHAQAREAALTFRGAVSCRDYNPCWLLVGDREALFYIEVGSAERPEVVELPPGIHVLENRPITAASAKVESVSRALGPAVCWHGRALLDGLHGVLRSHEIPASNRAADPGEGEGSPEMQAACVHAGAYGTRSASVVVMPSRRDAQPRVLYADGPPCIASMRDASGLWLVGHE